MIDRRAAPALAAGAVGLVCGGVALVTDDSWFGLLAGVSAIVAAVLAFLLAEQVSAVTEQAEDLGAKAMRAEAANDMMAARAARFEAEAIAARGSLAEAMRSESVNGGIVDPDSGLFNGRFFSVSLDKRVAAARRGLRPLSIAVFEVASGVASGQPKPADAKSVADCLIQTLRDADTACRLDDGRFALILEDTAENGAVWTVERVRRRLAEDRDRAVLVLLAGVACYPAHAFDSGQILDQAERALTAARDWRQDRIEVAVPPED